MPGVAEGRKNCPTHGPLVIGVIEQAIEFVFGDDQGELEFGFVLASGLALGFVRTLGRRRLL
jgi:hypothetical protein